MGSALRFGLVAGEASGDLLGASLIQALRERAPQAQFIGVAGPRMKAAGCQALASSEELAVMGFVEPLRHLPRLMRLRSRLLRSFSAGGFSAFIGIDAPAFNLGLARKLRARGLPTVQYVSPQVWAWRQGRVRKIAASVDEVLCLLPFETAFYAEHEVRAEFVGHPLADQVPLVADRAAARAALAITDDAPLVALLPGSREGEVRRLGADFAAAARELARTHQPAPRFVAPMANAHVRGIFAQQVAQAGAEVTLLDGQSGVALSAADVGLVASGTATLEALLYRCPMVVAYRVAPMTAFLARSLGLLKVPYVSQPNLLAGEAAVPELLQEAVTPQALSAALSKALSDRAWQQMLKERFEGIHLQLRRNAAERAAQAVLSLVAARSGASAEGR
ncbi:MAG: lipid-A-disaccharide synthase [Nevskiaceae bacterium]|jgi:lipid-A-disaccharide synthase|nr:lipid-A-disaccharide synthase [Nevskiaceae bacterium]